MFHKMAPICAAGLIAMAAPGMADDAVTPVRANIDVIPTDAIRVEISQSDQTECAKQVIWAFNLPEGSLMYHPQCEVVADPIPFASASTR